MSSDYPNCEPIPGVSRRGLLSNMALGFGGLAFSAMLGNQSDASDRSLMPRPHFAPRASRVIFLFMHGGPSHIDLFDPKPELTKRDGQPLPFKGARVVFAERGNLMRSPWKFRQHGEGGLPMSELWQHLPSVSDELCMIHSACETNVAHGGACMKLHTGDEAFVRPSMGAWIGYGLGSENENLPGFVTICPLRSMAVSTTSVLPSCRRGIRACRSEHPGIRTRWPRMPVSSSCATRNGLCRSKPYN